MIHLFGYRFFSVRSRYMNTRDDQLVRQDPREERRRHRVECQQRRDELLDLAVRADATRIATSWSVSFTKPSVAPDASQLERCTTRNQ
jgi:hypothetical protein